MAPSCKVTKRNDLKLQRLGKKINEEAQFSAIKVKEMVVMLDTKVKFNYAFLQNDANR